MRMDHGSMDAEALVARWSRSRTSSSTGSRHHSDSLWPSISFSTRAKKHPASDGGVFFFRFRLDIRGVSRYNDYVVLMKRKLNYGLRIYPSRRL